MSINWPLDFDDADSLMGVKADRLVCTLAAPFSVDDTTAQINEDISGLELPTWAAFRGGEVVLIETVQDGNLLLIPLENRAQLNSLIQPHGIGEQLIFGIFAEDINLLRDAIMAIQKHQGLQGLDASKPANPDPGWRYWATDTEKVYYCFVDNTWTQVSYDRHARMLGVGDDDHSQYHTDVRFDTWHDAIAGEHVDEGDDHDHLTAGQGSAVVRLRSGLESGLPSTPEKAGAVYWATDTSTLWIGYGGTWHSVNAVPSGAVAMFDGACPSGWSPFTGLQSKWPYVGPTAGATGGTTTHTHDLSEVKEHYHTVSASAFSLSSTAHSHEWGRGINAGGTSWKRAHDDGAGRDTGPGGSYHTHNFTRPWHETANNVPGTLVSGSASSLPPSREVWFCQKD